MMHKWSNTTQAQRADESLDQVGIYVPTQVSTLVYTHVSVYYMVTHLSTVCGCTTGTESGLWNTI